MQNLVPLIIRRKYTSEKGLGDEELEKHYAKLANTDRNG